MKVKHILRSKKWSAVIIGVLLLILFGLIVLSIRFFDRFDLSKPVPIFLNGSYSVDGGEWKQIDSDREITDNFKKITFKGTLRSEITYYSNVSVSTKNVWFTFKDKKGKVIYDFVYETADQAYDKYILDQHYEKYIGYEFCNREYFKEHFFDYAGYPFAAYMPNTPGYNVEDYDFTSILHDYSDKDEFTLEVENPYPMNRVSFSDCFSVLLSQSNGKYLQFFFDALPPLLLYLLVCFFGMFFFPVAGFILGKVNYKYLIFGVLAFTWGLFMMVKDISGYLNMWVTDQSVCLLISTVSNYLFIIAMILYLKSNLERSINRAIGNVLATIYTILVIVCIVLQFAAVADMFATFTYMFGFTAVCAVVMTVLLIIEMRSSKKAYYLLVSWIPLAITLIIDAVNHYIHFTDVDFYFFGISVTMIYQIIRLVMDLRTQYKETIRYQKMQKELYEARVSVMVSQIQPHFMYNTLSSIAMLCKLDPDTAYQATITFSQYLRSNMDSLKQTKLVPFEQELEHLKKYLYIEKLRFGKKLNIEYDIQATDFKLPQLSIQPLAENAVKHGISKKRGGGTLTIATRETDTDYEIIISDDGVGFDPNAPKPDDGRSHIGMENIHRRLKEMCNAEIIIESEVGKGTVATVKLPKEDQNNEDNVR